MAAKSHRQKAKSHRATLASIWPFAVPMGLTILPSLEAARLYAWWAAVLVFNVVWITLRLSDHWAAGKRYGFLRRVLMATSIVILAETIVLATTIDVCRSDHPGCLSVSLPEASQFRSEVIRVAQALHLFSREARQVPKAPNAPSAL